MKSIFFLYDHKSSPLYKKLHDFKIICLFFFSFSFHFISILMYMYWVSSGNFPHQSLIEDLPDISLKLDSHLKPNL